MVSKPSSREERDSHKDKRETSKKNIIPSHGFHYNGKIKVTQRRCSRIMLKLFNTLTRKKEIFHSLQRRKVGFYACGPTVYQYAHLGNLRTYIFEDILKRVLMLAGFRVRHVMNITDVGHLTSDEDTGEDKVEKEAAKQRKSAWDLARFYEKAFKEDIKKLNILSPDIFPRATEHIPEQINLIKKLEDKGYTYRTKDGIYFDTRKFKHYGALARKNVKGIKAGARVAKGEKRHPTDFALWKFSLPRQQVGPTSGGTKRQMQWNSPWGVGFPGWHIECSAMSMAYLGESFDIHAGGIDHVPIHHTNEIAESEALTAKRFVNFWVHGNFLVVGKKGAGPARQTRMGKSEGNILTVADIEERGFHALDFRYFALTAHYRSPLVFSWEALEASRRARAVLGEYLRAASKTSALDAQKKELMKFFEDDLHTPKALALLWKLIHAKKASRDLLLFADHVLGLSLLSELHKKRESIPVSIKKLAEKREILRKEKKWAEADALRKELSHRGWRVEDTPKGPKLSSQ